MENICVECKIKNPNLDKVVFLPMLGFNFIK